MLKSFKITISGQVQGVGFRPFVYKLAHQFHLNGSVSNNEEGVIIYVTGLKKQIILFYNKLIETPPVVSKIIKHTLKEIDYLKFDEFQIISSNKEGKLNVQLTPDFAICENCKKEITNQKNRRYNYPFTTCVHCGPRWSITNTFPFERNHTSLVNFKMCEACTEEYTNPIDRRFHSQTNSCEQCGIRIEVTDHNNIPLHITKGEVFKKVAKLIDDGKIVAIKNTGGYLLCCDATNKKAIQKLRQKKNRPNKPFAILYPSLFSLEKDLQTTKTQKKLLNSAERPIVILPKKTFTGNLALTELISGLNQIGIMLPYSGILQLLALELENPIVATSGNLHGSPIISEQKESLLILKDICDYFLHHNLEITNPQDDSVVKFSFKFNQQVIFRRSRGYAPNYFSPPIKSDKKIMALGGHLKSTIAFLPNDYLYISQYLGNLDHFDVYDRLTQTVSEFIDIFENDPDIIVIDKHPSYQSSQYGLELSQKFNINIHKVQHHKAHFASVLGEHELFESTIPILGVIWDGTGYGDDKQIWGGEFFTYQKKKIERLTHFNYFDWLAGDKMAKEPRISFFALAENFMNSDILNKFTSNELKIYTSLKEENMLKTSSVGRLFDAVSSLLNICDKNTYEGEAAILLENCITDYNINTCKTYHPFTKTNDISTQLILKNIYSDHKKGLAKEIIITNFLFTLASIILHISRLNNIYNIALSGGVFQNTILTDMIKELSQDKVELFFNRKLAPNDENISYGQIMYFLNCTE